MLAGDAMRRSTWPFVLALLGSSASAQSAFRLSAPLERAPTGDVLRARSSRDGSRVLYQARPEDGAAIRLYRAALEGSEPVVDLGAVLGGEEAYDLTEDGTHVVHLRVESGTGRVQLVGRRGDGSGPELDLSQGLGSVLDFLLAPAGDLVLFRAAAIPGEGADLYASPTRGGRVFRVNAPRTAGETVEPGYVLGPDGRSVYYLRESEPGTNELFRGSVVGRTPRRLCAPHASRSAVEEFALTGDNRHVVYRADSRASGLFELFVAPTDGSSAPQRVHTELPVNADVRSFALAPDSSRIVFLADLASAGKIELHAVALDGSGLVRLNQDLGPTADVLDFVPAPDSTEVVFRANADGLANAELFRAPLDGSSPAERLGPDLPSGTNVRPGYLLRGRHVLFLMHEPGFEKVYAIERVPLAVPVFLGAPLLGAEPLLASARRFFFTGASGLESVPIDLSSPPVVVPSPGNIVAIAEGPTERLLGVQSRSYETVGRETVHTSDLLAVPAEGSVSAQRVSAPFRGTVLIEGIQRYLADPTGRLAAYSMGWDRNRLFLVPTGGVAEPVLVTQTSRLFAFSFDGQDLVAVDDGGLFRFTERDGRIDLEPGASGFTLAGNARKVIAMRQQEVLVFPLDGGPRVDVAAALPPGLTVTDFALSDDGSRALLWTQDSTGTGEIYRVPADGSAAPEAIPSSFGVEPYSFVLNADLTRIAFVVSNQLFVSTVAGGAPSVQVSAGLAPIYRYEFDAAGHGLIVLDGGDVVLHRFDGTTLPLNTAHPGLVLQFELDPTGARAVYATEVRRGFTDLTYDLWSVPLDGSASAVRINTDEVGPTGSRHLPPDLGLGLSPDGRTAVFTSLGRLVSAPLDASAAPRVLVDDPARFSFALPGLEFTEDSLTLVYAVDGLHEVEVQGGRPERRLDSAEARLRNAGAFQVLAGRHGVLFLADPLAPGAHELFNAPLDHAVRGVPR